MLQRIKSKQIFLSNKLDPYVLDKRLPLNPCPSLMVLHTSRPVRANTLLFQQYFPTILPRGCLWFLEPGLRTHVHSLHRAPSRMPQTLSTVLHANVSYCTAIITTGGKKILAYNSAQRETGFTSEISMIRHTFLFSRTLMDAFSSVVPKLFMWNQL